MPDYFSHFICAQKILESCNKIARSAVTDRTLYFLGAQGGDVFFAYKFLLGKGNLGTRLHTIDAYALFNLLSEGNLSYACGFATHYAVDCMLHPSVYAYENTVKQPLAHMRFESDLGLYISRKFCITRRILPYEGVISATFKLYDSISKVEPQVTLTGVERCLKRHFAYSKQLLKHKRTVYALPYDFSSLCGAVDDAVAFGAECVNSVAEGKIDEELFSRSFNAR